MTGINRGNFFDPRRVVFRPEQAVRSGRLPSGGAAE
jgi:hypothetical protein